MHNNQAYDQDFYDYIKANPDIRSEFLRDPQKIELEFLARNLERVVRMKKHLDRVILFQLEFEL